MRCPRLNIVLVAAVALCVALVGCSSKTPPREGGASGSKAEKARKDAEALAVGAVKGAAEVQARAVPESAAHREIIIFGERVRIDSGMHVSVSSKSSDPPKTARPGGQNRLPEPPALPAPTAPAASAVRGPSGPKTAPRAGPPALFRERVKSAIPYSTEADAEEDALTQARDLVEQKLAALDPPVRHKPSLTDVKAEFVRQDSRTVRPLNADDKEAFALYEMNGNYVFVEYDVEVTPDQVRELRAQERVSAVLRILGVLVAVALAGFLFLRADEWTRGYLTSWLALGAVGLAGGAAAALIFV